MEPTHGESLWPLSTSGYNLTLGTIADNLALDECLLASVDKEPSQACIRFWQPTEYCVVLGRSNKPELEVAIDYCVVKQIPVVRRASGGGAVVLGPGCLCYSLALPVDDRHRALGISNVTAELMSRTAAGLVEHCPDVQVLGLSDLALNDLKFSGNAQRWLKNSFIHHGTLLFDFDLTMIERCLRHPTREPDYRNSRQHQEFVSNLKLSSEELQRCISQAWNVKPADYPAASVAEALKLSASRKNSPDWNILQFS